MVTTNLSSPTPQTSTSPPPIQHRQNRRRERPGSRARRTISRKSALATDLNEGIIEARDSSFYIPNHRPGNGPSPLLRQNLDQSWMRWKARQTAELEMLAMKQNMKQLEMERQIMIGEVKGREEELGKMQRRLFGGDDDDDDALCRMKALHPSAPTSTSQNQYKMSKPRNYSHTAFDRQSSVVQNQGVKFEFSKHTSQSDFYDEQESARLI